MSFLYVTKLFPVHRHNVIFLVVNITVKRHAHLLMLTMMIIMIKTHTYYNVDVGLNVKKEALFVNVLSMHFNYSDMTLILNYFYLGFTWIQGERRKEQCMDAMWLKMHTAVLYELWTFDIFLSKLNECAVTAEACVEWTVYDMKCYFVSKESLKLPMKPNFWDYIGKFSIRSIDIVALNFVIEKGLQTLIFHKFCRLINFNYSSYKVSLP